MYLCVFVVLGDSKRVFSVCLLCWGDSKRIFLCVYCVGGDSKRVFLCVWVIEYCAYPAMSKSSTQLHVKQSSEKSSRSFVLIVFNIYRYHVATIALHESGTRKDVLDL